MPDQCIARLVFFWSGGPHHGSRRPDQVLVPDQGQDPVDTLADRIELAHVLAIVESAVPLGGALQAVAARAGQRASVRSAQHRIALGSRFLVLLGFLGVSTHWANSAATSSSILVQPRSPRR